MTAEEHMENTRHTEKHGYTGFLLIRCEHCGEVRGFCAKKPIETYFCNHCKGKTVLRDIKLMYQECECGGSFKYRTNLTEKYVANKCLHCGRLVEMRLNGRGTTYVTPHK